jgi:hypothetical protein
MKDKLTQAGAGGPSDRDCRRDGGWAEGSVVSTPIPVPDWRPRFGGAIRCVRTNRLVLNRGSVWM